MAHWNDTPHNGTASASDRGGKIGIGISERRDGEAAQLRFYTMPVRDATIVRIRTTPTPAAILPGGRS